MTIELYTAPAPNARRVTLIIEELGLPYHIHNLNLDKGEHRKPEYLKLNPLGEVPLIIDPQGPDGKPLMLAQSGAIAVYLADKAGRLLPKDMRGRAEVLQQLLHVVADIASISTAIFTLREAGGSTGMPQFKSRMAAHLAVIDQRLSNQEYLSDELSIADFSLFPLALIPQVSGAVAEGNLRHLQRWKDMIAERPSVIRGLAATPANQ